MFWPLFVCFFTLFGCWGGGGVPMGLGHNLLMQFSSLGNSKMEISKTHFFDSLTIHNDQISYVKHFFAPLCVCGAGWPISQQGWAMRAGRASLEAP